LLLKGGINMRVTERSGRYPKKEMDYQVVPKPASFVPPAAGVDVLLATGRQKRAHVIRGL